MNSLWQAGTLSFGTAVLLTPLARWIGHHLYPLDVPNARSSHAVPTPRTGGLAIVFAVAVACLALNATSGVSGVILLGSAVICLLALVDDVMTLHVGMRFLVQLGVATAVVMTAGLRLVSDSVVVRGAIPDVALLVLTVLWIVWFTNAFNFMDGINGIAGAEAMVCSATFAVLFARDGDGVAAIVSVAAAAAAAGFLPWNFPRASIFMGDVGSAPMGFLLAALAARLAYTGHLAAAVLPLLPFMLDSTLTLLARAARRERIWEAHRSHWYQRLAQRVGHVRVTSIYALLALVGGVSAVAFEWLAPSARIGLFTAIVLAHLLAGRAIDAYTEKPPAAAS